MSLISQVLRVYTLHIHKPKCSYNGYNFLCIKMDLLTFSTRRKKHVDFFLEQYLYMSLFLDWSSKHPLELITFTNSPLCAHCSLFMVTLTSVKKRKILESCSRKCFSLFFKFQCLVLVKYRILIGTNYAINKMPKILKLDRHIESFANFL